MASPTPSPRTVKRDFPVVPECFRGEECAKDIHVVTKAREQRAREEMVAVEQVKMLAEKVKACFRKEGVNHYRNCEDVARAYMNLIKRLSAPDASSVGQAE